MEFVPFQNEYACDGFYGLSDMELKTVSVLEQELADQEAARTAVVPDKPNLFGRKAAQVAASVAVLIGLDIPFAYDRCRIKGAHRIVFIVAARCQHRRGAANQDGGKHPKKSLFHNCFVLEVNSVAKVGKNRQSTKYYLVFFMNLSLGPDPVDRE